MRILKRKLEFLNSRYEEHKLSIDDFRRIKVVKMLFPKYLPIMLDVGCYDGTVSTHLRPNGTTVIGLELSRTAAQKAKEKIDEVVICDIEESLPLRDNACNFVYASEIIEHLFDPGYFLEEVRRVLKPGRGFNYVE